GERGGGVYAGGPPATQSVRHIAKKPADRHELAPGVNRWYGMAGRQRDNLIGMGKKKTVAADLERVNPLLNKICKGRLDLARGACIHRQEAYPLSACRNLHLSRFGLRINGIGWVAEGTGRRGPRHQFWQ